MTDRDYNHSRPLDVHRWSNFPEVNPFIDELYNNHIIEKGIKKYIKFFDS